MKPDLKAIADRAGKATAGPWEYEPEENCCIAGIWSKIGCVFEGDCENDENGNFIARARTDIPALLDYIAELEAVTQAARTLRDKFRGRGSSRVELTARIKIMASLMNDFETFDEALAKLDGDGI